MSTGLRQIPNSVHLVGIGGSGMAALAHCLFEMGVKVSGSDLRTSDQTARLGGLGIRIDIGHAAKNVARAKLIVVSDAIPAQNVELAEARIRNIPVIRRANCLDLICNTKRAVMISGAHGKSTTTAMIATLLAKGGADPSFAIGADVPILGNKRAWIAPGVHFVVEACEAFQNLYAYHPDIAVITNIDDEHLDHYGSQEKIDAAFTNFANRTATGVVANGDDIGVSRISKNITRPITTFGLAAHNHVSAAHLEFDGNGSRFDIRIGSKICGAVDLPVLGKHMVLNALAAFATTQLLGIDLNHVIDGLRNFTGVRRRWEQHDAAGHIRLVDDFAHHPIEIAAIRNTASAQFSACRRRIIAFQPQLFSRTKRLLREFGKELAKFDAVFLLEIDGGGEHDPGDVNSLLLANEIRKFNGVVDVFDDVDDLVRRAPQLLTPNDLLITAGAGNIAFAAARLASQYRAGVAILTEKTSDQMAASDAKAKSSIRLAGGRDHLFTDYDRDVTVLDLLHEQTLQHPSQTAVFDGKQSLSYIGLHNASERVSQLLQDYGVSRSDVVGVRLSSSIELIVLVVALAKIGAVYMPLDVNLPTERSNFMLGQAKARLLVTANVPALNQCAENLSVLGLDKVSTALAELSSIKISADRILKPSIATNDTAYICFTSGSTGQPKGISVSHMSLANLVLGVRDLFKINGETRMILGTSISFDVSIGEIWMTLCGGGELRATGSYKPLVGERLSKFIRQNAVTHLAITPSVLASMPPAELPSLRCIISAGEACPKNLMDTWAADRDFFNAYGPTEATIYATVARLTAGSKVSIGTPLPNVIMRILHTDLRQVEIAEAGELCLGGAGIASGYIGLEAQTHEHFIDWSTPSGTIERLYRTGDLVKQDCDGIIEYIGRIDSQVKILGNRVELEEIEQTIKRYPCILDVAVCIDTENATKDLVCFVVLQQEDEFDWASFREGLANWLPLYMVPTACVPVNEILLTPSGKKDRRSLLTGYRSKKVRRIEYVPPQNETEYKLAAIWKSVLKAEADIGVFEDFAWLGGDSLKALLLILEIEEVFKVPVPPGYFGTIYTINRMAAQIASLLDSPDFLATCTLEGFRSTAVYKQLRDLTAGWSGLRATPDAIIVTDGGTSPVYDIFLCVQLEEELHSIAKHFGPKLRVHAMRSGHLVMDYNPDSINALCEHYIGEMRAIQPTGKLLVGGICQGGLIAATMANMLRDRGYDIHLLVLLEQSRLVDYDGAIAFFYSEDSFVNPYRRFSTGLARYDEIYRDRYSLDLIPGEHGYIHMPPSVQMLVYKLERRLAALAIANDDADTSNDNVAKPLVFSRGFENCQNEGAAHVEAEPLKTLGVVGERPADLISHSAVIQSNVFQSLAARARRLFRKAKPLDRCDRKSWPKGLDFTPLFNRAGYLERNPDVAVSNSDPLEHYLNSGMSEGRPGWSDHDLSAWQKDLLEDSDLALRETGRSASRWPILRRGDLVHIHAHSQGHFVFQQFQQLLRQAFQAVGINCVLADERQQRSDRQPDLRIVVAPHDFYYLAGGPAPGTDEFINSIPLNSEQMQSHWFAKALPFILRAPFVLDLNLQTAASLARLGINAKFLPLGYVPENEIFRLQKRLPRDTAVRGLPPTFAKPPPAIDAPWTARAIDVLLIGSNSDRRTNFVARNTSFFASNNCLVRLVKVIGALEKSNPRAISPLAFAGLAQRSKILLNIHHFDTPYFEWQRLMHYGFMQCCCVVTERISRVPGLAPGEHYFEDELNKLPALMEWLLNDKDGQERAETVRLAGYRTAISCFQLSRTLCELFEIHKGE